MGIGLEHSMTHLLENDSRNDYIWSQAFWFLSALYPNIFLFFAGTSLLYSMSFTSWLLVERSGLVLYSS